jgi:hypothetical protein
MIRPPLDPRDRPLVDRPTWQSVVASYALVAAIPFLLWLVSSPVAGTVTLAAIAGLFVGGRRAHRLVRCFYDCQQFTVDLLGRARITVAQTPANEGT